MNKVAELTLKITNLKNEIRTLETKDDPEATAQAVKKAADLKDLVNDYKIAKALEDAEMATFTAGAERVHGGLTKSGNGKAVNRIFNKILFGAHNGWNLTDTEKADFKNEIIGIREDDNGKGGYLVPKEQFNTIEEYRREYVQLRDIVNMVPVKSKTGTVPSIGKENGTLTKFTNLTEIPKSDLDFGQMDYNIDDYGDIIPVALSFLEDVDTDITSLVGQRFAKKAVNTENNDILTTIKGATAVDATSYKDIIKCLNKTLDSAISANSIILTSASGYDYLDELEDKNGRPLLKESLADPTMPIFKGRQVMHVSDTLAAKMLPTGKEAAMPFAVGSFKDAIRLFMRRGYYISISTEAGFTMDAVYLKVKERYQVKTFDADAMRLLCMTLA